MNFREDSVMSKAEQLVKQVQELSTDEQWSIVRSLLETLDPIDPNIEQSWLDVAERRMNEIDSGEVDPVPGPDVLRRMRERATKR